MTTSQQPQSNELDEIDEAWRKWKAEDTPENRRAMLAAVSPQVGTALHAFAPGMEKNLLVKANTLTMKAAATYDPSKGMHFKSYVYQQLQPLQRICGKRTNVVEIPERHIIEGSRLNEEENRFVDENGYAPSVAELADFTGISVKRIEAIRKHKGSVSSSKGTSETGDPISGQKEDLQHVWCDYVYNSLPSMDQKIYEWRTGYGGVQQIPVTEIAKRLNVSQGYVSQRLSKIIGMIQEGMNVDQ